MNYQEQITVCVWTHIINASTTPYLKNDMLIETIKSVKEDIKLDKVKFEIYCDNNMKIQYPELTKIYLANIKSMLVENNLDSLNIEIVQNTGTTLRGNWECAANRVKTPYLIFLEHDWKFVYPLDFEKIINTLNRYKEISYLKFNRWPLDGRSYPSLTHWEWRFEPETSLSEAEIPLSKCSFWSGNPHIMRVSAIKDFYLPTLNEKVPLEKAVGRSFLERDIKPIIEQDIKNLGHDKALEMWGTYIYGTVPHPPVVEHTGDWCRKK